jgi:hypothetical protein
MAGLTAYFVFSSYIGLYLIGHRYAPKPDTAYSLGTLGITKNVSIRLNNNYTRANKKYGTQKEHISYILPPIFKINNIYF